jgi:transposase
MQTITTVGLDVAKSVFQVHCVDANGDVVLRRQLKRRYVLAFFQKLPPCLVGIEACVSSHHWSRQRDGRKRQDRQGAWPDCATVDPTPRRRGDRMSAPSKLVAIQPVEDRAAPAW